MISDSLRKYIVIGFVLLIGVSIMISKVMAGKQDEQYQNEQALYEQAVALYSEQQYAEIPTYTEELLKNKGDSESVNYLAALTAIANEEYVQGATLMQKTLELNPYKAEDPLFMLQLGEVLFFAERYDDAQTVLERCRDMQWTAEEVPNYQEHVEQLLAQIESKKSEEGNTQ